MLAVIEICKKVLDLPSGREILDEYCQSCKAKSPSLDMKRQFFVQYAELNTSEENIDISELSNNLYFLSVAQPHVIEMIERDVLMAA